MVKSYETIPAQHPAQKNVARKVKCLNTGKVFESVSLAAAFAGCSQGTMSTAAIRDKEIKGMRFEYC